MRRLPLDGLQLQPVGGSDTGPVRTVRTFRDDALDTERRARPEQLARMLHVSPKTVTRWSRDGMLPAVVTPGGHRRYPLAVVLAFLGEMGFSEDAAASAYLVCRVLDGQMKAACAGLDALDTALLSVGVSILEGLASTAQFVRPTGQGE